MRSFHGTGGRGDQFVPSSYSDPITSAAEVTPSDTADLDHVARALYIGTQGDLKVTMADGMVVTFTELQAGWHPISVSRVWSTGTAADNIVAGW